MRVQQYEDEDDDDEPSLWTRLRSLLLHLSLQLYHRMTKAREQLQDGVRMLGDTADKVRQQQQESRHTPYTPALITGGCWTRPPRAPPTFL